MSPCDGTGAAPTISVVVPAYGRPNALIRAVESVRAADVRGVEIVVVDDASPDSLQPMIPEVNGSGVPVRYYRLPRNGGPQAARNLGIRRARFDYIAFLDSDDEFAADKIDVVRMHLLRQPYDLLFHAVDGVPGYARMAAFWDRHGRRLLPFEWLIVLLNPVVTPSLVIRRDMGLGPPGLRHAEDWAFLLRIIRPGMAVAYLDEPLSRVHRPIGAAGGQSAARWMMRKGEFQARSLLLKRAGKRNRFRFALGTVAGCVRVAADLLRRRYGPLRRRGSQ